MQSVIRSILVPECYVWNSGLASVLVALPEEGNTHQ